jgi:hypothetical protein
MMERSNVGAVKCKFAQINSHRGQKIARPNDSDPARCPVGEMSRWRDVRRRVVTEPIDVADVSADGSRFG